MPHLVDILHASWNVWQDTALYVLVGFALAGAVHVWGAGNRLLGRLAGRNVRSVLLASLIGLPLPLCSCGVLPTAIAVRRRGAAPGAVIAFLVAAPEIGIPSILITYALFGPFVAIFRPVAAFVVAVFAGLLVTVLGGDERPLPTSDHAGSCGDDCREHTARPIHWARRLYRFALVDLLDEIAGWLIVGIVVAGALRALLPEVPFEWALGGVIRPMVIMVLIGIPMYVCATSSTPIAAVLIGQGVNPGAALVFLLVGPATNIGSIGALARQLGPRTVALYLVAVVLAAIGLALAFNAAVLHGQIDLAQSVEASGMEAPSLAQWVGSLLLLGFCGRSLIRRAVAWRAKRRVQASSR